MSTAPDSTVVTKPASAPRAVEGATTQIASTSATPEQIDLVYALRLLAEMIPGMLPRVITGDADSASWSELADVLFRAARLCREQVVIDVPA